MVSIEKCVSTFPKFDRLCLNAGGLAPIAMHESSGVTQTMVINALGASCLVDGLLAANKVPANARIVYIGSEVTHTIVKLYWFDAELHVVRRKRFGLGHIVRVMHPRSRTCLRLLRSNRVRHAFCVQK